MKCLSAGYNYRWEIHRKWLGGQHSQGQERRLEFILEGHGASVQSIALSEVSRLIVSGSEDTSVKVWSIADQREEFHS